MGRPARVSPDRILAAAALEFAERGYAGARVDRIARRARVNKAMLYYHFHSKQGLYRALLRQIFSRASEAPAGRRRQRPPARRERSTARLPASPRFIQRAHVLSRDHAPRGRRRRRPSGSRDARDAGRLPAHRARDRRRRDRPQGASAPCTRSRRTSRCSPPLSSTSPARRFATSSPQRACHQQRRHFARRVRPARAGDGAQGARVRPAGPPRRRRPPRSAAAPSSRKRSRADASPNPVIARNSRVLAGSRAAVLGLPRSRLRVPDEAAGRSRPRLRAGRGDRGAGGHAGRGRAARAARRRRRSRQRRRGCRPAGYRRRGARRSRVRRRTSHRPTRSCGCSSPARGAEDIRQAEAQVAAAQADAAAADAELAAAQADVDRFETSARIQLGHRASSATTPWRGGMWRGHARRARAIASVPRAKMSRGCAPARGRKRSTPPAPASPPQTRRSPPGRRRSPTPPSWRRSPAS